MYNEQYQNPYMYGPNFYNQGMNNLEEEKEKKMVDLDMSKLPRVIQKKQVDINVFDNYHNKVQDKEPEMMDINIAADVNINEDALYNALINYKNLSDTELRNIIFNNFRFILKQIFDSSYANNKFMGLIVIFTDLRILQIFGEVAFNMTLTREEIIYCNKLVYDYIAFSKTVDNCEQILTAMNTFSSIVNRDVIPILTGFGYVEKLALKMAMNGRSSTDDAINIKRLNKVLLELPLEIVTEDNIKAIYYTLYKRVTPMLEGIMFDVQDITKLSTNQREIYALINLSILGILDNMNDNDLRLVLSNYTKDRSMLYMDRHTRFNMRSFSPDDYPRLDYMMRRMDQENGTPLIY